VLTAYNLYTDAYEYEINNSHISPTECRNVLPLDAFLSKDTYQNRREAVPYIFPPLCFSVMTGVHFQGLERLEREDDELITTKWQNLYRLYPRLMNKGT
jgi:hypothetical protein